MPTSYGELYAAELARVTIWIGEIQWMIRHGLGYGDQPRTCAHANAQAMEGTAAKRSDILDRIVIDPRGGALIRPKRAVS